MNGQDDWLERMLEESRFLARYPLYAAVLASMIPVRTRAIEVMAVAVNPRDRDPGTYLLVNPDYFAHHPKHRAGVLMHEVHHIVLGHLTHPKFRAPDHPDLMELAMEVSANEYIDEPLPDGAVTLDRFSGLRPGQSTLERYALLVAARDAGRPEPSAGPSGKGPASLDDHRPPGGGGLGDQLFPPTADPCRVPDRSILVEEWLAAIRSSPGRNARRAGRIGPWPLESLLRELTEPHETQPVPWRTILDRLVPPRRLCTWKRPNRRFPNRVGEVPGRRRQRPKPALLAAIDTSGSMSSEVLAQIVHELRSLAGLATMTVVECDDAIQRVYPFSGDIKAVAGGGNTDFRPVFEPELLSAHGPDAIVYFTDGQGACPDQEPEVPTVWCLTAAVPFPCSWGWQVRVV